MDDRSELPAAPDPTPGVVGIVGAGTMGAGIAQVALEAGERVLIHDPDPGALERARERIADGLARRSRRRVLGSSGSAVDVEGALGRLEDVPDLETLARAADVVVEAALEDLLVKQAIFARLDAAADPARVLATNTSALSVGEIAAATRHPERVVGLHFFNPAPLMALVEVVAPPGADPLVVASALARVADWSKTPVLTADTPGFIVNRVNRPFTLEGLALLEAGVGSIEAIDAAIRADGFPMGPFELMDLVGIDVNLAAARGIFEGFSYEPRFRPSEIQERLVEAGRLGRKSGEGFYWYGEDGRRLGPAGAFAADAELVAVPSPAWSSLPSGETGAEAFDRLGPIVERIVLAIVNEAYWALGEDVASAGDIDLALRLGAGHPSGPFERTAALGGPAAVVVRLERWQSAGPRFVPAPALLEAAGSTA
jgi:3-hydroxybutyryl-CoA dehydrogenase